MVRGTESFREWFSGYEEQYVLIGGTACDMLMSDEGLDFRATKDFDLVLIVEAIQPDFGKRFWEYIRAGNYEHRNKSSGTPQFYRFIHPTSPEFPAMIELFTRKPDTVLLPDDAFLTPLPLDDDISSLSAILLDDSYYEFMKQGRTVVSGVSVLDAQHLIPFKAKAWLDLSVRKAAGDPVDSKNIRKHKNDVFRLSELLPREPVEALAVPASVMADIAEFLSLMEQEEVNLPQLGIRGRSKEEIISNIRSVYLPRDVLL